MGRPPRYWRVGEEWEPKADAGLELGGRAPERRVGGAVGGPLERRVGDAPVDELGRRRKCRTDLANAVAQGDHAVEPLGTELVEVFGSASGDVEPVRAKDADGVRVQRFRVAPGARGVDRSGRHVLEERFGDL